MLMVDGRQAGLWRQPQLLPTAAAAGQPTCHLLSFGRGGAKVI